MFGSYYYAARPDAPASSGAFYWVEDALGDAVMAEHSHPLASSESPPIYQYPYDQTTVRAVAEACAIDERAAVRLLKFTDWDCTRACENYLEHGMPSASATAAQREVQLESPNRKKRSRSRRDAAGIEVAAAEAPRAPLPLDKASRFAAAALGASLSLAIVDDDDDGAVQELYAANGLRAFEDDDDLLTVALRGAEGALEAAATLNRFGVTSSEHGAYDGYEVVDFAVDEAVRGGGRGKALFQALCLAISASTPRRVLVLTYPRDVALPFWRGLMKDWNEGGVEGELWCAVCDLDDIFHYEQSPAKTLFWSESSDGHLSQCSPWFAAEVATKLQM